MNILQLDSAAAWAGAICSLWRDRLRITPDLKMCLPTGLTPLPVYGEMIRGVRAGHVSFARAAVFALDEFGGLARDDPGRTSHTLRRELIGAVDLPPAAFHVLDPDVADLDEHCAAYEAAIGDGFDLVLLGIGTNGHLGMNEPGASPSSPTRRADLDESTIQASARYFAHQNLPRWGLTVGLERILSAKEVWVLATGPGKAEIVRRTIDGAITRDNPASLLRRHSNCWFFLDDEAAGAWRSNTRTHA